MFWLVINSQEGWHYTCCSNIGRNKKPIDLSLTPQGLPSARRVSAHSFSGARAAPWGLLFKKGQASMRRGRKRLKELSYRDKKIVNRLTSSCDTMSQLAKKHGVSKQRIHQILEKAKELGYVINRPRLLPRYHEIPRCEVCSRILQVPENDSLITGRQLSQMLNIDYRICRWHLNQLKVSGFVSKEFATMRSDRLAKALQCYRYSSLSPSAVGRKFGYKNFYSLLSYQRKRGIDVERMPDLPAVTVLRQESHTKVPPSMS
jgi:DNA-binding Lrp family transcriptional regulator